MKMNFFKSYDEIMKMATKKNCIIGGFNVYGLDDAVAIVNAAEELHSPVILMVNKLALQIASLEVWADMLNGIAKRASVPICVHLDHTYDLNIVERAVKSGYDSIMFDGSGLPFEENVKKTKAAVDIIHANGLLAEAELGLVSYSDSKDKTVGMMTNPKEAEIFVKETRTDWLAISIGNVHRMEKQTTKIDFKTLNSIESVTDVPLVIHGSTGITDEEMKKLMLSKVSKANIGTALRMSFGKTLHDTTKNNPDIFDRYDLLKDATQALKLQVSKKIELLGSKNFFE